jgi:tRNA-Thr(GGU) m(6)t(6)A37 methyltransferase TsaA
MAAPMDSTVSDSAVTNFSKKDFRIQAIGVYRSEQKQPFEAARQPREDARHIGEIQLFEGQNFEQALTGLADFERIWVIFRFHENEHWKPMVRPPRGTDVKIGVFATRAPYRPNGLGLSCVRLVSITGRKLVIEGADLLDGTPVFDIKPYVAEADAFPQSRSGWLEGVETSKWQVSFTAYAQNKLRWLEDLGIVNLRAFLIQQLEYEPFDEDRKRVKPLPASEGFEIAYRTWRAHFRPKFGGPGEQALEIFSIASGYSTEDLREGQTDRWADKDLHRRFISHFAKPSRTAPADD